MQVVHSTHQGKWDIEHLGSAHDELQLELLKAAAQRIRAGQGEFELGLPAEAGGPLPILASRMSHLWDACSRAFDVLGFGAATRADQVFGALVLTRVIEPTSNLDAARMLSEVGVHAPSYPTVERRLPVYATTGFRTRVAGACAAAARLGSASLVLIDVSTLHFETDDGDGLREPGFSKERRLDPQITIGLLTDAAGFPLMVHAFEGNRAETSTMLPVSARSWPPNV